MQVPHPRDLSDEEVSRIAKIIEAGLLQVAGNWQEVAALLLKDMEGSPPKNEIINQSLEYIKERQGGAEKACRAITALMEGN